MNSELTEKLFSEFPHLYRGHTKPPEQSSMCWGFQCGDGWFEIIRDLSRDLDSCLQHRPSLELEVIQVKSKFGSLRFEVDGGDAITKKLIEHACERAKHVCELTGSQGRLCVSDRGRGSPSRSCPMVLCEEKAKELGYSPYD